MIGGSRRRCPAAVSWIVVEDSPPGVTQQSRESIRDYVLQPQAMEPRSSHRPLDGHEVDSHRDPARPATHSRSAVSIESELAAFRGRATIRRASILTCIAALALHVDDASAGPRSGRGTAAEEPKKSTKLRDQQARTYLAAGWSYYNDGEWDRAIEEWRKGALIEPSAVWNWNFGQANRQAGRFEKARWNYERFIAEAADIPGTEEAIANARRFIEEIDKAKTSPPRGPVEEPTTVHRATVAPPPHVAPAGFVREPSRSERWSDDWVGWSFLGLGVMGGIAGAGLIWDAASAESDARDERNHERRLSLLEDAETRRETGAATLALSGAIAIAGIVKLAIAPERRVTGIARYLDAGPSWVGVRIRFE